MASAKLRIALVVGSAIPASWVAWDCLTRGGFSLRLAGLALVGWDGRRAARWRCGWRSLLVWAPPFALLIASAWVQGQMPTSGRAPWVPFGLAVALLPVYVASAFASPARGPHDRLSGLRVVPR